MTVKTLPSAAVYDHRYETTNYRQHLDGFEIARWAAVTHFIKRIVKPNNQPKVLDYGAGAGLHVGLWEDCFVEPELNFCDISSAAQRRFCQRYPRYAPSYSVMSGGVAPYEDNTFDIVASLEVMEHVEDLEGYIGDICRVLKPGGVFVWTTPCANRWSIEHAFSSLTRQIVPTSEGYRVWAWEDPTHVRRLRTYEIGARLREAGFDDTEFRLRSHVFSFVGTYFPPRYRFAFLREQMMKLDYLLFRRMKNGASMLGVTRKRVLPKQ